MTKKVIMVTGGSGLVGKGIQTALSTDKREDEEWIFLSSKDANLLSKEETLAVFEKYKPTHWVTLCLGSNNAQNGSECLSDIEQHIR